MGARHLLSGHTPHSTRPCADLQRFAGLGSPLSNVRTCRVEVRGFGRCEWQCAGRLRSRDVDYSGRKRSPASPHSIVVAASLPGRQLPSTKVRCPSGSSSRTVYDTRSLPRQLNTSLSSGTGVTLNVTTIRVSLGSISGGSTSPVTPPWHPSRDTKARKLVELRCGSRAGSTVQVATAPSGSCEHAAIATSSTAATAQRTLITRVSSTARPNARICRVPSGRVVTPRDLESEPADPGVRQTESRRRA